jgi:hypothetical protein
MKNQKLDKKIDDFIQFSKNKLSYFDNLINNTIKAYNIFRTLEIISSSEMNACIKKIEYIYTKCENIKLNLLNNNIVKTKILDELQIINNEFFTLLKSYGCLTIDDILKVSFGNDYSEQFDGNPIFYILKNHLMPIHFKVLSWNNKTSNFLTSSNNELQMKNKIIEDTTIAEKANNCDCFDLSRTHKNFFIRVDGIKTCFHNEKDKKTLIVSGLLDNILVKCYNNSFVNDKLTQLIQIYNNEEQFNNINFYTYIQSLKLKELLIYSNLEHCNRYIGYRNKLDLMKQKPISQIVKEFINDDVYIQRQTLINLLIHCNDPETQYIAYLFYDLLSNDDKTNIDTKEQNMIYDSLPWNLKHKFKEAMKLTIDYTKSIANFDNHKIPLEQQICLMRVDDNVKEKAMTKLKEIKSKSEDSGSKARQYLDGLLKIPFGIFKKEHCLTIQKNMFSNLIKFIKEYNLQNEIELLNISLDNINTCSSKQIMTYIHNNYIKDLHDNNICNIIQELTNCKRDKLVKNILMINSFIKKNNFNHKKLIYSGKNVEFIKQEIIEFIHFINTMKTSYIENLIHGSKLNIKKNIKMGEDFQKIKNDWKDVKHTISNVKTILDKSVYGHEKAKRQIERIIGQWMSGELKGYCFGFEGAPGVGKTSLAKKGLANCLVDKDGISRPFGFIAIGGSSNGSTLDGHNYTYVGSTWGRIVDILMESKCMNPIIFIDELDKVSKTEHGKEIIGILTHLVDPTQNDTFQDKYFNGIDIDLSKALFIFSYNDPSLLDRILLDRIHRVKFDNLSVKDKIVITNEYILPEIYNKINLKNSIHFSNEIIEYIIENFTCESGVRKLKEILFEIISEINLQLLREEDNEIEYPIQITKDLLKNKYLKDHREIKPKVIHENHEVGIINGLWANALGRGGIIPIQTTYFPTSNFLELKLTGMQGDVMKESMNVAKSLAYKLTSQKRQKELLKIFKDTHLQGLHIHCPEGAVPKDGPSAGTAITTCIYSLLNKKKIKKNIAITGEINLQGFVTAIGGLDLKILGGIKAGVTEFIFPDENMDDFNDFMKKYKDNELLKGITFHKVQHINEVLKLVFV